MTDIKPNKNRVGVNNAPIRVIKELEDGLDPSVLSKQILIKGENGRIFTDFVRKIRQNTIVNSKIEEELLKKYIFSAWKLRRMRELEKETLNRQQVYELENPFWELGEKKIKRRVRNLSKIRLNDEVRGIIAEQEKLEKQMIKALRHFREEQSLKNKLVK